MVVVADDVVVVVVVGLSLFRNKNSNSRGLEGDCDNDDNSAFGDQELVEETEFVEAVEA